MCVNSTREAVLCSEPTSHLLQQLTDLLPVLPLTIIDDMVSPTTALNYLSQAWMFFLQVMLWKTI